MGHAGFHTGIRRTLRGVDTDLLLNFLVRRRGGVDGLRVLSSEFLRRESLLAGAGIDDALQVASEILHQALVLGENLVVCCTEGFREVLVRG